MKNEDKYFNQKLEKIEKFQFNRDVALVFDDMVSRSVPFYNEIHTLILDLMDRAYRPETRIYDLGCSTGSTLALIDQHLKSQNKERGQLIGIDNSAAMLEVCQEKLQPLGVEDLELECLNIEDINFKDSGLIIMNYTLQFISPEKRLEILKKIYESLCPGGIFILSEKIDLEDKKLHQLATELYYDFKRRSGYSELEISQKREALEEVLRPLTPEQQMQQLKEAGFQHIDTLFRWYNFTCYVGLK